MAESDSIIHIGELSKPATVLIEKISEAIGGLARPWQLKRVAEAEAEAERVHAVAQIEITKLQKRAMTRLIAEEARKQQNIEAITAIAIPQLDSDAKPENVEDDWIANFFDKCRLISNEDMQKLWARILAGEANSPGKFSKRSVALLSSMDKSDAAGFTKVCDFACRIEAEIAPVILKYDHEIYVKHGLNYPLLSHLDTIGLIRFEIDPRQTFTVDQLPQHTVVRYFGQEIQIAFPNPGIPMPPEHELKVGQALFTDAGQQLADICEANPVHGFVELLKQAWHVFGP
jgi:hypothetical protein